MANGQFVVDTIEVHVSVTTKWNKSNRKSADEIHDLFAKEELCQSKSDDNVLIQNNIEK